MWRCFMKRMVVYLIKAMKTLCTHCTDVLIGWYSISVWCNVTENHIASIASYLFFGAMSAMPNQGALHQKYTDTHTIRCLVQWVQLKITIYIRHFQTRSKKRNSLSLKFCHVLKILIMLFLGVVVSHREHINRYNILIYRIYQAVFRIDSSWPFTC